MIKPEHEMEKVLYAIDELALGWLVQWLLYACPSKSVQDPRIEISKKYKNAKFAAGCSREANWTGADMLIGWELDELILKKQ